MSSRSRAPKPGAKRPTAKQFRIDYLVHDVSRIRRTLIDQTMRPLGVTRSQWSMLSTLSRGGNDGMMQNDLARLMEVAKVTVSGLVSRLEATGHVERRIDAEDRRGRRVYVTEQGYQVIGVMIGVAAKINQRVLRGVSAEHRQIAEDVLLRIKENMKEALRETSARASAEKFGSMLPERDTSDPGN